MAKQLEEGSIFTSETPRTIPHKIISFDNSAFQDFNRPYITDAIPTVELDLVNIESIKEPENLLYYFNGHDTLVSAYIPGGKYIGVYQELRDRGVNIIIILHSKSIEPSIKEVYHKLGIVFVKTVSQLSDYLAKTQKP
jgi:hypothetical protein